jgi:methionyl aminopeptidase
MIVRTPEEIEGLQRVGRLVAEILSEMMAATRPGITTADLDAIAARRMNAVGARSAPFADYQFPGYTCISINEEVAHGIPGRRQIQPGDLVHIDVSAEWNGFYGDTGCAVSMAPSPVLHGRLLRATREALHAALAYVKPGAKFQEMGRIMEKTARVHGFAVLRDLCSHGIGRTLHEEPDNIPGWADPDERRTMQKGMVFTIEPFLTTGRTTTQTARDQWTVMNVRGSRTVQMEHTIIVTDDGPLITTRAADTSF